MRLLFALQVAPHPIRLGIEDIRLLLAVTHILSTLEARFPPTGLIISSAIRKGTALAIDTLLSVSDGLACRWDSQLRCSSNAILLWPS